jgi:hypothetical protein
MARSVADLKYLQHVASNTRKEQLTGRLRYPCLERRQEVDDDLQVSSISAIAAGLDQRALCLTLVLREKFVDVRGRVTNDSFARRCLGRRLN